MPHAFGHGPLTSEQTKFFARISEESGIPAGEILFTLLSALPSLGGFTDPNFIDRPLSKPGPARGAALQNLANLERTVGPGTVKEALDLLRGKTPQERALNVFAPLPLRAQTQIGKAPRGGTVLRGILTGLGGAVRQGPLITNAESDNPLVGSPLILR